MAKGKSDYLVLYRFFDADGELLYIGRSVDVWRRLQDHCNGSRFYGEAASVTLQRGFACEKDLCAAEVEAIRIEKPRYNIAHNGGRPIGGRTHPRPRRARRGFGRLRQRDSGRWYASYLHVGALHRAPVSFPSKDAAAAWLQSERDLIDLDVRRAGTWTPPGARDGCAVS